MWKWKHAKIAQKYEGLGLVMWYSLYSWNILGIWLVVDSFWYATYILQSYPQTVNIEVKSQILDINSR
jgi:hypothetical protein